MSTPMNTPENKEPELSVFARASRILLPLGAIACGILITLWLLNNKPQAKQRPKMKNITIVEARSAEESVYPVNIEAMGLVVAAQSISLSPEVNGQLVETAPHFVLGGAFKQGQLIAQIDSRDYQLNLSTQEANLAASKAELQLERGNQLVAQKEFELLGETVSAEEKALMLRTPQLDQIKAQYASALAAVNRAKLDLERTRIKAPFNGMISSISANLGSYVSNGAGLATYVGTDTFWLELLLPVSDLQWISIPTQKNDTGSLVRIYNESQWGSASREGRIIELLPSLEENGRLARVLVAIDDPLAILPQNADLPKLLLNSYVRAEIQGHSIEAVAIDRKHIHDGDKLWILTPEQTLEIREVTPIYKDKSLVFIQDDIGENELYITSPLAAPVDGMLLERDIQSTQKGPKAMPKKDTANDEIKGAGASVQQ